MPGAGCDAPPNQSTHLAMGLTPERYHPGRPCGDAAPCAVYYFPPVTGITGFATEPLCSGGAMTVEAWPMRSPTMYSHAFHSTPPVPWRFMTRPGWWNCPQCAGPPLKDQSEAGLLMNTRREIGDCCCRHRRRKKRKLIIRLGPNGCVKRHRNPLSLSFTGGELG